jgi:hypothetical protein
MPAGTPSEKVLQAVDKLETSEWKLKHRYAMVLHTDTPHPHMSGHQVGLVGSYAAVARAKLHPRGTDFAQGAMI